MNADEWKEFEHWANEINARRIELPAAQQIPFLKSVLKNTDPRWKSAATTWFFSTCDAMQREERQFERHRELRYFWAGIAGLLLCVVLVLLVPLSRNQVYVLQLIASLSAAALLAYMPGMLEVDLRLKDTNSWWGGKIRGTSAGAAFVIVWLVLPSLVVTPK
jgi:hypothetical protein